MLAHAPGLGWSNSDHPGHTLFALLATLLSSGAIDDALKTEIEATGRDLLESLAMAEEDKPNFTTPSIAALIERTRSSITLSDADCDAAIDARRVAAEIAYAPERRVERGEWKSVGEPGDRTRYVDMAAAVAGRRPSSRRGGEVFTTAQTFPVSSCMLPISCVAEGLRSGRGERGALRCSLDVRPAPSAHSEATRGNE